MGIAQTIGQRIRNYRLQNKLSQEELAERAGCHHTYIGQIERGEKNASIESIDKIASALGISLSKLFEFLGSETPKEDDYAYQAYELIIASKSFKGRSSSSTIVVGKHSSAQTILR